MMKAVVILEVMWDWQNQTSSAGYVEQAPPYFRMNPDNFTASRLYAMLGDKYDFVATNACPQLVSSARGKGKPDKAWLSKNLVKLQPFDLLLVCGRVAKSTYRIMDAGGARIVEMPHPAARTWTREGLSFAKRIIQEGNQPTELYFRDGRLVATTLIPF